jgi:uncharacterized protein YndB with AHSA1/START domain
MNDDFTATTPSDVEVAMVRTFAAPRALVFEAHTTCEHLKHWWGRGNPLGCELDFRPGGTYRFVEHAPDGREYAFHGEYLKIQPPELIEYTFEYEGAPGHTCVQTLEFAEEGGRTTLTATTRFATRGERDAMVAAGLQHGARQSYEALAAYLAAIS